MGIPLEYQKTAIKRATLPGGYIRVWKVVKSLRKGCESKRAGFYPEMYCTYERHKAGRQKACGLVFGLRNMSRTGWHAFRDRKSAEKWRRSESLVIIECLVHPSWIIQVGSERRMRTIRCSEMVFPKYPSKVALVRDYKKSLTKREKVGN